jgi:hypothetical protein
MRTDTVKHGQRDIAEQSTEGDYVSRREGWLTQRERKGPDGRPQGTERCGDAGVLGEMVRSARNSGRTREECHHGGEEKPW